MLNLRNPLLLAGVLVSVTVLEIWIFFGARCGVAAESQWSYIGDDHPQTWPRPHRDPVLLKRENTIRYQVDKEGADEEWARLYPNNGIVTLGANKRPFMVSMFHQLRCLDIIRQTIVHSAAENGTQHESNHLSEWQGSVPSEEAQHCVGYLRQMALCRANTQIEPIMTFTSVPHTCNDWTVAYI